MVTTRIALHVSGEQEYPVPGLPAPPDTSRLSEVERLQPAAPGCASLDPDALDQFEAVRLFIARAGAVRPGFAVTNANAPAVAGIAARLHGMPLAIELAAARVKLLTPDQILARLDHHLAVADRRLARPPGAPADPARGDRLELRPARRRGAPAARPAVGLPRRLRR